MAKYIKKHSTDKAFKSHLSKLRERGAVILTKVKGSVKVIEYSFKGKK